MAVRWRIAILLAVITTINYIDRSVFGVVAPVCEVNLVSVMPIMD